MSDYNSKCTKIDFGWGLGLCPRPCCGSLQCSPRPTSWNKVDLLLNEREGCREGRGRARGRQGRGAEAGRRPHVYL